MTWPSGGGYRITTSPKQAKSNKTCNWQLIFDRLAKDSCVCDVLSSGSGVVDSFSNGKADREERWVLETRNLTLTRTSRRMICKVSENTTNEFCQETRNLNRETFTEGLGVTTDTYLSQNDMQSVRKYHKWILSNTQPKIEQFRQVLQFWLALCQKWA